jgi:hypothetical protein
MKKALFGVVDSEAQAVSIFLGALTIPGVEPVIAPGSGTLKPCLL